MHDAVVTCQETLSYHELDRRSARMARALLAAGAGKGTRVALLAPDGVFWVTGFLAALRIGALLTTVSTLSTPPELAHILRTSDCQILVGTRRFLGHDYAATLEAALPGLAGGRCDEFRLKEAPCLRSIWLDDVEDLAWARPVEDLLAMADEPDAPDDTLLAEVEREVSPGDDAIVVFTSGSTARPKAVVHRQWAVARHSPELARNFAMTGDARMMCLLPSFWLAGLSTMMQVLSVGGTLVYPGSPEVGDALDAIERFRVNRVNAWGDKQPKLIAAAKAKGIDLGTIPELSGFRDASGNRLPQKIPMYGMTESFSAHSAWPLNEPLPPGKEDGFGIAINGYERRVVDPETGQELPPGEVGELRIRGPAMLSDLYKRERSDVFTPDGFYPTRDLVRIDKDGWLFPAGRLDDMIKTRGANVSRLEVEAALLALPEVAMAVVAGLPDEEFGKVVVAAVVPEQGTSPTQESLQLALRDTLSSFKVPRRIVFISETAIPRTATGKVKLSETAAMIGARA
ncbi:MAG: acyl--CoA ligase [Novosphingobium sp.]|nr:acyl--CoA ligase [Novosphingobium sp.]MCP5404135.1 acyl--CoA ligase [Novosphingobium sp.]